MNRIIVPIFAIAMFFSNMAHADNPTKLTATEVNSNQTARTRCRLSSVIESEPWGFTSPHAFLNIGAALAWDRTPFELLSITQFVERIMGSANHRDIRGRYVDRLIDIDIIAIDSVHLSTPRLILPHPRAMMRPFVTEPLRQLGFNF